MSAALEGSVAGLYLSDTHDFTKHPIESATFVAGLGVEGDAHAGATTRHEYRMKIAPDEPNLRQVHLIAHELHDELNANGFTVVGGGLGENVTTRGIALGELPVGTTLRLGDDVIISLTGFRDPCSLIDKAQKGLRAAVSFDPGSGPKLFRDGVMSVVVRGGTVRVGDTIKVSLPPEPHQPMQKV